jgi:hypothetical protein
VFAKLNTGAYLIAVFAFGVASMKAMTGYSMRCGSRTTSNHQRPQWYGDTFGCGEADAEQDFHSVTLKLG